MKATYPTEVEQLVQAVSHSNGHSTANLRQNIMTYARQLTEKEPVQLEVPAHLKTFVNKVALNPYKIIDADIGTLQKAGVSEDEIFEITISAALGASLVRLERGLSVLQGTTPCV